jgi:hypothetical protein
MQTIAYDVDVDALLRGYEEELATEFLSWHERMVALIGGVFSWDDWEPITAICSQLADQFRASVGQPGGYWSTGLLTDMLAALEGVALNGTDPDEVPVAGTHLRLGNLFRLMGAEADKQTETLARG